VVGNVAKSNQINHNNAAARIVRNDEVSGSIEFHEPPQMLVPLGYADVARRYNAESKRLWGRSLDLSARHLISAGLPSYKSRFAFRSSSKGSNQQPDQQNAMSCATSVFLGSSRGLASRCKVYSVQIHTVVVTGSSPVAPTIFLKALPGIC